MPTSRFCPVCKSSNVALHAGGQTGCYQCNKCGYIGVLFLSERTRLQKGKKKTFKTR